MPRPRAQLTRNHGVFAPNCKHPHRISPTPSTNPPARGEHAHAVRLARYPFVKGGDRDGWELSLTTAVKNALGPVAATDLALGYSTLEERTIARIDVRPGAEPVFASRKGEERQIFFARLNNSTEELSGPALLSYQRKHWPE